MEEPHVEERPCAVNEDDDSKCADECKRAADERKRVTDNKRKLRAPSITRRSFSAAPSNDVPWGLSLADRERDVSPRACGALFALPRRLSQPRARARSMPRARSVVRSRSASAPASPFALARRMSQARVIRSDSDDSGDEVLVVVDNVNSLAKDDFVDFQTNVVTAHAVEQVGPKRRSRLQALVNRFTKRRER